MSGSDRAGELLAISRAITSTTNYEETLSLVVEKACAFSGANACILLLADPGSPAAVVASFGIPPAKLGTVTKRDIALDERIEASLRGSLELAPDDEVTAVPMIMGGSVRGSLVVIGGRRDDDHALLSALADQASITIGHMAHLRELERAVDAATLLRALADTVPSMLAYWDSNLRCRFANRAYQQWFGVSPEALIGKHVSELLGSLYSPSLPYIERVFRGEAQEFEREIPDPGGGPARSGLAHYTPDTVDGVVRGFFVVVTDVSMMKRAELALRDSEERFKLTIEEAPIGMALVATDGRFVRVNRALCELVGYRADELVGLRFQNIIHRDDLDADLTLAARLTRGELPRYELGKRYVRKDGSIVDVMLHVSVIRNADGSPRYFIAQIEDVTAAKRAAEQLRQSQERFELALDGADLASWDWNVTTGEVVFNRRWAEMRGMRPEEITPHVDSWIQGIHPDDRARVEKAISDHFEGRRADYESEHRIVTKSGQWMWILDRGKAFARDAHGRPTRMTGTELDITDRKRAQIAQSFLAEVGPILATTLDYDETLSRIADLAVRDTADLCIVDLVAEDGSVRRVRVACRDPSKKWLADQLMGTRIDRQRPHVTKSVLETRQPVLMPHTTAEMIASFAQNDDHLRVLQAAEIRSIVSVPLVAKTKLIGAIAFISSTPSRIYGPADLRLAEELAERAALSIENARLYSAARRATQARDDVLGIVAHDLRNPLNNIMMQANLLVRSGEPRTTSAAVYIERAVMRMDRLIRDLLDVTRIDAGRLSVEAKRVAPHEVLSDCLEAHRQLASPASIELRDEIAPNLPDVRADRDRLLQIFENLIGNAFKFTKAGGRITVGAAAKDGSVVFWVADTGEGIAPENRPHLFDRFWQAKKGERRGAGLGLPIVKGLVEAHSGRIWVESTPGKGSTFFFTIPAAVPAPSARHSLRHRA